MSTVLSLLQNIGYNFEGNGTYRRCKQHDSLVVNTDKDYFYWNSKGKGGDALTFLLEIENLSYKEAMSVLSNYDYRKQNISYSTETKITLPSEYQINYLQQRAGFYHKSLLRDENKRTYWYKQGINNYSIHTFKLGWAYECPVTPYIDSYTIPYIKGSDIINIRHRLNINGSDKYRPEMSGLSNYLYNVNGLYRQDGLNWPGDAILLEGEKKAIVFHQHGFRAVSIPGANAWKAEFIKEFHDAGINYIYVMLDPGMEEQANRISDFLNRMGKKSKPIFLPEKPDDMLNNGTTAREILREL